jgi:hypothetical protein
MFSLHCRNLPHRTEAIALSGFQSPLQPVQHPLLLFYRKYMLHFIDVSLSVNVGAVLSRIVISALWLQQRFRSCQPNSCSCMKLLLATTAILGQRQRMLHSTALSSWLFHWLHRQSLLLFYRKYMLHLYRW